MPAFRHVASAAREALPSCLCGTSCCGIHVPQGTEILRPGGQAAGWAYVLLRQHLKDSPGSWRGNESAEVHVPPLHLLGGRAASIRQRRGLQLLDLLYKLDAPDKAQTMRLQPPCAWHIWRR